MSTQSDLDLILRTAPAFGKARQAIDVLERFAVWPTPLNYELGLHYVSDPEGPLATEVNRLLAEGVLHSDDLGESLARKFLPRLRFEDQLSDASGALMRQLDHIGRVLDGTRASNAEVVGSMTAAGDGLAASTEIAEARKHLSAAADAIRTAESRTEGFTAQLDASAAEMEELRIQLERLRREAMTDPLTGIANRRAFEQNLEQACAEADASGDSLTLAMIDIDHFKRFNDRWGHPTGDQVIRFVASQLIAFSTPPRTAARYGGEEFAVIMPRVSEGEATGSLEAICNGVAVRHLRRRTTQEDLGQVTISIGVAERASGKTPAALIEEADRALYASKQAGRNRVTRASEIAALAEGYNSEQTADVALHDLVEGRRALSS